MPLFPLSKRFPSTELAVGSLSNVRDEMNRLLDGMFLRPFAAPTMLEAGDGSAWIPAIDLSETDTEIQLRAELPGVKPEEVDVSVSGERLTISGEKKSSKETKGNGWIHRETACGAFSRTLTLPDSVDPAKVTAKCENGVLVVTLVKQPSSKAHKIPVACG